ncbi:MAG: glycosyl transferase [Crocinitomicaceae bacterium]|nr:glycosyl transferase [Crocinitomicaceae bacterium]|tara:strand:+ start:890 stop:2521 length:1632 start_codon:yes stop_codon:yes gene_type:complete
MKNVKFRHAVLGVIALSVILYYPFLGMVHLFDWDEINFAEAAREMLVTGNYSAVQIDYLPFWEKPPLFLWMQAISMNLIGIGDYAARFPNAIAGTCTLFLFLYLGKRLKNIQFGLIWVALYASSLLPQLYFRSGIIDPWFNLFIFTGIWFAHEYVKTKKEENENLKYIAFAGLSIGLGVMTKGPVALLIFLLVAFVYWAISRFKVIFTIKGIVTFLTVFAITGSLWFVIEIASGRAYIVEDFIMYQIRLLQTQDAGHGGPFLYHWYVLLVGCFPLSILAAFQLFKKDKYSESSLQFNQIMLVLFWVVLLLFSLVKTKIIHYSSLCYFPLSYFAANYLVAHLNDRSGRGFNVVLFTLGGLLVLLFVGVPYVGMNVDLLLDSGLMNDPFAEANLQAEINWGIIDFLPALLLLLGLIGFSVYNNKRKWYSLVAGSLLSFTAMGVLLIPKIELITQNAAIEFYESKQNEDCYIKTYEYFSYAHLYYSRKQIPDDADHFKLEYLLSGDVTKPVYIVCKITSKDQFIESQENFDLLYEKNGFVFFKRIQ